MGAACTAEIRQSDTSDAAAQVPFYRFDSIEVLRLPDRCALVGVELHDDAIDLPSFRHPRRATYVLGRERGSLSPALIDCCDHVIKIPTRFALNLAAAGAIVMYDRLLSVGRFGDRPPVEALPPHAFGQPVLRRAGRDKRGARAYARRTEDQETIP